MRCYSRFWLINAYFIRYHSHPGFGCWLSGVDINTQQSFEALSDRLGFVRYINFYTWIWSFSVWFQGCCCCGRSHPVGEGQSCHWRLQTYQPKHDGAHIFCMILYWGWKHCANKHEFYTFEIFRFLVKSLGKPPVYWDTSRNQAYRRLSTGSIGGKLITWAI